MQKARRRSTPISRPEIETRLRKAGEVLRRLQLHNDEARGLGRLVVCCSRCGAPCNFGKSGWELDCDCASGDPVQSVTMRSTMPDPIVRSAFEDAAKELKSLPARPGPEEVTRMDEALAWLTWCYPTRSTYSIVLAHACGMSLRRIAAIDPAERGKTEIHRLYHQGIDMIFRGLNGLADNGAGTWREAVDPIAALRLAILTETRDWEADETLALVFQLVVGWGAALPQVARRHKWDADIVRRLLAFQIILERAAAPAK
jgi:hypothetical protein